MQMPAPAGRAFEEWCLEFYLGKGVLGGETDRAGGYLFGISAVATAATAATAAKT